MSRPGNSTRTLVIMVRAKRISEKTSHLRRRGEDSIRRQILAVGISKQGIEFDAIDGEPVHIVAVLATPRKHQKQHMELLAALSRVLQDEEVRSTLIGASRASEVVEALTER